MNSIVVQRDDHNEKDHHKKKCKSKRYEERGKRERTLWPFHSQHDQKVVIALFQYPNSLIPKLKAGVLFL